MSDGKKGLHPLAWVGIGCGVLLVLGLVAVVGGGLFVAKKVSDAVEEADGNPVKFIAEKIVQANPDIDLVSSDDDAGTMTVRNKKTGEEVTLNWADIKEGKFSVTTDEGTTSFSASGDGSGKGSVTISTPDGETRLGAAAGAASLPDWVPHYPGSNPESVYSSNANGKIAGSVGFKTADSLEKFAADFQQALEDAGYEVTTQAVSGNGTSMRFVTGNHSNGRMVNATATLDSESGESQVMLTYEGKP